MTKLFEPLKIRDVEVKNRIWVSPMCQYSCEQMDGVPSDWHLVHLGSRAVGGAGLVMAEASAVRSDGRITPWDTGIWNEQQQLAWQRVAEFISEQGSVPAIQLAHAGRKASVHREWSGSGSIPLVDGGWQTVSSTATAFEGYAAPRALDEQELPELVRAFADAASRAVAAGFQLVEIHAAHGYLIHQFLSPLSNDRQDAYGGSLENRARLLLDIVSATRSAIGSGIPIAIRFSGTDYIAEGWDIEQTAIVAGWCQELGADLFDISSGGLILGAPVPLGPGYQVPLAARLRSQQELNPVAAVGLITEPQQAEDILRRGEADVIMLGRVLLRDPYWPLRAAHELGAEISWPNQYRRGRWPS
jgi:2,4-dienoyl-CoA reductase-like NADH-dependent reductase (Old Yellow Enzyme family)